MFLLNFQDTKLSERIRKKIIWERTLVKGGIDASFNDKIFRLIFLSANPPLVNEMTDLKPE